MPGAAHTSRPGAGVVWARVEDGFHVGSRDGNFLGYIERAADGYFDACDMRSRPVGRFPTLVSAMSALSGAPSIEAPRRR
ncbi:hypothetical protein ACIQLJ_01375 [Microbacterium sp. NPDC091313]